MASWWDRHVVPHFIRCACSQPAIMTAREKLVPLASGAVCELGCGGGINLPLYQPGAISSFAGVDPSAELLEDTRAKVRALGVADDIRQGFGEDMPFASGSFDTVVTTFTLCSVNEPARVLAEIRRILKPDGRALFLEHGRAPDADVERWQHRIEPVWKRLAGNCHLSRPITAAYDAAGFRTEQLGARYMPKTPRPVGWVEWGVARL